MELFKNLRLNYGRSVLRKRSASVKRVSKSFNFSTTEKIGILWDATDDSGYHDLLAFNKKLTESGKHIEVLAWIPGKTVSDKLIGLTNMKFLKTTDINFAFIPFSEDAKSFMGKKYDVLIDINPSRVFPLTYIAALSPSPMKVGVDNDSDTQNSPYDLMIQTGRVINIGTFLEQVSHYLSIINNSSTRV
jgi:hypothetical protein